MPGIASDDRLVAPGRGRHAPVCLDDSELIGYDVLWREGLSIGVFRLHLVRAGRPYRSLLRNRRRVRSGGSGAKIRLDALVGRRRRRIGAPLDFLWTGVAAAESLDSDLCDGSINYNIPPVVWHRIGDLSGFRARPVTCGCAGGHSEIRPGSRPGCPVRRPLMFHRADPASEDRYGPPIGR
jgi:hypothetical protein